LWIDGAWELIGKTRLDLSDYYTKDETDEQFLSLSGGKMTGYIDLDGHALTGVNFISSRDGIFMCDSTIQMINGYTVTDLPQPIADSEAANKVYVDQTVETAVSGKISAAAITSIEVVDEYPMTEAEGVLYLKRAAI
jgi:hypothetical protein